MCYELQRITIRFIAIQAFFFCIALAPATAEHPREGASNKKTSRPPLIAEDIFRQCAPAVVRIDVRDKNLSLIGQGSGFLISRDGLIATNHHVIERAFIATVVLHDGKTYMAEGVSGTDIDADLAILKIAAVEYPYLDLSKDDPPAVGEKVYVIGSPRGLTNTLSEGIVSAYRELEEVTQLIQLSAPISPGSSGGPLLDQYGRVVGVTTLSIIDGQNLNFAVPSNRLAMLANKRETIVALSTLGRTSLRVDDSASLTRIEEAIDAEDFAEALKLTSTLPPRSRDSSLYWYMLAYINSRLGNFDLAVDACQETIKRDSRHIAAHHLWAYCLRQTVEANEAINISRKAVTIDPSNADSYLELGLSYLGAGDHRQAVASLESSLRLDANSEVANRTLGIAYHAIGAYREAVHAIERAIGINSEELENYVLLANVCYDAAKSMSQSQSRASEEGKRGEYEELRLSELKYREKEVNARHRIAHLNPSDKTNRYLLGVAYSALSHASHYGLAYEKNAVEIYEDLLLSKSDDSDVIYSLASSYEALGEFDKAIRLYKHAAAIQISLNQLVNLHLKDIELARKYFLKFDVPSGWTELPAKPWVFGRIARFVLSVHDSSSPSTIIDIKSWNMQSIGLQRSVMEHVQEWAPSFSLSPRDIKVEKQVIGEFDFHYYRLEGEWHPLNGGAPRPDYALHVVYIDGRGGPWVCQLIGPGEIVNPFVSDFLRMAKSARRP